MLDDVTDNLPLGEKAYRTIKADVIFGRLTPGQRLTLDRMKEAYGTSVSTLREIFSRLSAEGFVVAEGSRGFQVMPISETNLREVAAMRQLLERHALRESFEAGDIEWEANVVAAHHRLDSMERRIAGGMPADMELWKRYDRAFHHALISACGSRVLLETHATVYDKYLRYQMIGAAFRGDATAGEHRRLLECALARDWQSAQTTLVTHVQDCVKDMLAGKLKEIGRSAP